MELKRICDTITCWENTFTQELRQTAQTEVIVPDTCPDVVQLYENSAMVFIDSRRAMDGKIEVAGSVRCEILYQAAEEELVRQVFVVRNVRYVVRSCACCDGS